MNTTTETQASQIEDAFSLTEIETIEFPEKTRENDTMPQQSEKIEQAPEKEKTRKKKKKLTARGEKLKAKASAELVVSGFDMLREGIADLPADPNDHQRKMCIEAWEAYSHETGFEPPAWVLVSLMSAAYMTPVFVAPKTKGFFSRMGSKIKSFYHYLRGKK